MSALRRCSGLVLAVGVLALSGVTPASAADEISIDHVESDRGTVNLLVSTDGLPAGSTVLPEDVRVELNGGAVEASAKMVDTGDIDRVLGRPGDVRHRGHRDHGPTRGDRGDERPL